MECYTLTNSVGANMKELIIVVYSTLYQDYRHEDEVIENLETFISDLLLNGDDIKIVLEG